MAWLQLIRWKNLLIIFLTQALAWACVVLPEQRAGNISLLLDARNFLCLALSTVLIAAAGYIINDYFDVKIDNINHPEKVVLGKVIPRKSAIIMHTVFNVVALLLAGHVAALAHHYEWLLLQLGCTLLLWLYSTRLKRSYIAGNVAVAVLTSLTVLTLIIYEPAMHRNMFLASVGRSRPSLPVWILAVYAYFAFMLTWMREIVKDMEDLKGDEAEGCVTMPIVRGLHYASRFAVVLAILVIIPLASGAVLLLAAGHYLLAGYALLLLAAPLAAWSISLGRKADTQHYHRASRGLKIIMVLGICSLLIYYIQLS